MSDTLVSGLVSHRQAMLDELYAIHGRAKRLLNDVAAIEAAILVLEPAITLEASMIDPAASSPRLHRPP